MASETLAISSKRSVEQSGQLMSTRKMSWGMRTVPVRVFSWILRDTRKGFPPRSLRVNIASAWDSVSTMTRGDIRWREEDYPSHLCLDAFFKLESIF